nr:MAG TPA: hypothetical protein [Caudoviricetes sp.]
MFSKVLTSFLSIYFRIFNKISKSVCIRFKSLECIIHSYLFSSITCTIFSVFLK